MNYLETLNEQQLEGVVTTEGPVLILAGAGSGKTKVLVSRAAYLIDSIGVSPYNILAITFTNKAANEMKSRMQNMIECDTQYMWIGTFHSICMRILRAELASTPYRDNFVVYDDSDQQVLVKKCLLELGLDEKKFAPRAVLAEISKAKNDLLTPEEYLANSFDPWREDVGRVYRLYQHRLISNNALDFDDLIMAVVRLLENNEEMLMKYQNKFKYILVDEYQDTNYSQYKLIQLLAAGFRNICAVGDPDQSIYRWRGADISNILNFEKDYPEATIIKLEQNYRSTQTILDASNAVIDYNTQRKAKNLWTNAGEGELIHYHELPTDREEAMFVIREIVRLRKEKDLNYNDFAIIYRTHTQSRVIEDALVKYALPYRVFGGLRFYDRKEIKDTLAYLKTLTNPDDEISLYRIINEPKRGIGESTWQNLVKEARSRGISVLAAMDDEEVLSCLKPAAKRSVAAFMNIINDLKMRMTEMSIDSFLQEMWTSTGYYDYIKSDEDDVTVQARLDNLGEFLSLAVDFMQTNEENSLSDFLALLSLSTDMDNWQEHDDFISLLTMHATKGLEFSVVFMTGMEEKLFPHSRSLLDNVEMEEERRLCYVGMTRAKKVLYLTRATERMMYGRRDMLLPSRFLDEIPDQHLDTHIIERPIYNANDYSSYAGYYDGERTGSFASKSKPYGSGSGQSLFSRPEVKPTQSAADVQLFNLGDKVQHAKFGVGVIVQITGSGDDAQIMVAFPNEGIKNLMVKYAPIKKIQ